MRYLVTGADGFLGRHFLSELHDRDLPVRAMIQPGNPEGELPGGPERCRADLLDPDALRAATEGVTHVIHLAARVHMMDDPAEDPDQAFQEVNVTGTRHLLEAAEDAGAEQFLLMSSVKAMGEEATGTFDETTPPKPATPYGRSKLAAEETLLAFAGGHRINGVALRLPMVYGPGAKGNVLRLLEAAERDRKLPFGSIRNQRSMVYVGNVVDAALLAVAKPEAAGEVFLVCDARPYSTRELYGEICRAMGKDPLLRRVPVPVLKILAKVGDAAGFLSRRTAPINSEVVNRVAGDLCFRCEKIRTKLGWQARYDLREGIEQTVRWYHRERAASGQE